MHYTLHLTESCNLACRYCYVRQAASYMTFDTAKKAVDMAAAPGRNTGLIFFGGEPLLCRDMIYSVVDYAEHVMREKDVRFHFKITTNGTLLDDSFIKYSLDHDIFTAFSHDGTKAAQDANRIHPDGSGTYDELFPRAKALLRARPYSPVMMTVDPSCVAQYAEGVQQLFDIGFRYILCSMNYAGAWDEVSVSELKKQYLLLAAFYERHTLAEDKFYLSPFEVKLSSHIRGGSFKAERCELGKKQISVAPDGSLYPCVQFVGDPAYSIGHVDTGIDEARRYELYSVNENEKSECAGCAIKERCNHHCGCLNRQVTGSIERVAPSLCAHERTLVPIADMVGERLFKKRSGMFIQKQYNDMYPLLSAIDDRGMPGGR